MAAGYDISASTADALAQAANASAPTFVNFGSGDIAAEIGGQTADPKATATAARNATGSGNVQDGPLGSGPNTLLYIAIALSLLTLVFTLRK